MRTLIIVAASAALGCSHASAPAADNPSLAALRSAPPSAEVGLQTIILTASLWRDFEPPVPPGGRPLTVVIVVSTSDRAMWPAVELEAAWVVNGQDVWRPVLEYDPLVDPYPNTILKVGRDGPRWAPGTSVDVVVRVRDTAGRAYLIQAANQSVRSAS